MNEIKIHIGQMKVKPGDPFENCLTALSIVNKAKIEGADLVVLPEMCIPGYLIGDDWEKMDFLEECEQCNKKIIHASEGIVIAFGSVLTSNEEINEDGRVRKYNSCLVAEDGIVKNILIKTLQPNYREFEDNRHFYDKKKYITDKFLKISKDKIDYHNWLKKQYSPSINIKGQEVGFLLCEDAWDTDYASSPFNVLAPKCDMIVNISCSPFTMGKNSKRNRIFSKKAKEYKTPIVYVNNTGIQNNGKTIYVFDGNSCIYDSMGNQINPFDAFENSSVSIEINTKGTFGKEYEFQDDIATMHSALKYGIEKFIDQIGVKNVVIGASGGIDSAVVAALFSEVLPPQNIYLVNMPSRFNSSTTQNMAKKLAENIGCNYNVVPIESSVNETKKQIEEIGFKINDFCFENVQARDRSSRVLASIASSVGGVFTCNANKTEATVGYTTLYGDLSGFMAPLMDVWKTDVYKLARYINSRHEIIPNKIIEIRPTAELSENQNLEKGGGDPFIYKYHDLLFKSWVEKWNRATPSDILMWFYSNQLEKKLGYKGTIVGTTPECPECIFKNTKEFIEDLEKWWNLFDGFAYAKRIQAPPVMAVSRRSYGWDLRETQTPPFYSKTYKHMKNKIVNQEINQSENSLCEMIVTNGDRILCETCFEEGHDEQDEFTHLFDIIEQGICSSCGASTKNRRK